jgi:ABC-type polysaccharide/polyol phosphate export permease
MAAAVEGLRGALLGTASADSATGTSIFAVAVLAVVGLLYFQSTEKTFADVV